MSDAKLNLFNPDGGYYEQRWKSPTHGQSGGGKFGWDHFSCYADRANVAAHDFGTVYLFDSSS